MRFLQCFVVCLTLCGSAAKAEIAIDIHYILERVAGPATLSNLDPQPEDLGLSGAELGLQDNLTTGRFMGHNYTLTIHELNEGDDVSATARSALEQTEFVIIDAPSDTVLNIADLSESKGALIFNVAAPENDLRSANCRSNLLHTLPSRAMRADALMQFFVKRRWSDIAMIEGSREGDIAWANALERSATKFGLKVSDKKTWAFDADMRRNAAQEVPLFTQDFGDYDALIVADEADDFARYISFNTWLPRPVAGSEGLRPVAWHRVVEQWGAAQLQSRFEETAERPMKDKDYAAWAAVRTIGEAVTRANAGDASTLRDYILSDKFELAGFKGRPLTYRGWNGQLRQPIPLVHERALVAQAPLEGFLHQRTELDTLGLDEPESGCSAFE